MILNACLIDWLTITSYSDSDYHEFRTVFDTHQKTVGGPYEKGKWLQYVGPKTSHGFCGVGMQNGRRHYMSLYSGQSAHLAGLQLLDAELHEAKCTRIDCQITIPRPDNYKARKVKDAYHGELPHARQVEMYESDGATIYFGSMKTKNGRFSRLYEKEHATGWGLRWETEYKGAWAKEVWDNLRLGMEIHEALVLELESLGNTKIQPIATFYGLVKGYLPMPRPRPVETSNPTLDWLRNTVDPAVRRMLADHDHGWKVRRLVESWLDWPAGNA